MAVNVEIIGEFVAKNGDTIVLTSNNSFKHTTATAISYFNVILPGTFELVVPPQILKDLKGELLHVTFNGTVNVTPVDDCSVEMPFIGCNAQSNICWYWKYGLCQPEHKVEGATTVLFKQYEQYMNKCESMPITITVFVTITKTPQEVIERTGYGSEY